MRVQVDESRHQQLAARVDDDLVAGRRGTVSSRRADLGDDAVVDDDGRVRQDPVVLVDRDDVAGVLDAETGHAPVSSTSGKVARVCTSSSRTASTFAVLLARTALISSMVIGSVESPTPDAGFTTREIAA